MLASTSSENCGRALGVFTSNSNVRNEDVMLTSKCMCCFDDNRLIAALRDIYSFAAYGIACTVLLWPGKDCCSCCTSDRLLAAGLNAPLPGASMSG